LRGIEYIHKELRVVHRDIKPSNLLLNSQGEVKITDFGVSGKLANTIAKAQTFVGTVTYMSPERIRAQDHASNSDIWSLGLTILECALGYYPYRPPAPVTTSSSYPQPQQQGYTFFELLEDIQTNPAPNLPEEGFSKEFRDFINLR
jgi:mitogen-activated protein kinase kinase 1